MNVNQFSKLYAIPSVFRKSHASELVKGFNPDQARDQHGMWTSEGDSIVAFHGTKKSNLKNIFENGITLGKAHSFHGSNADGLLYQGDRGKAVYVTSSHETARWYAHQNSVAPAVIELRIPKEEFANYKADTLRQPYPNEASSAYSLSAIKPEWIVEAEYYPSDKLGVFQNAVSIYPGHFKKVLDGQFVTLWVVVDLAA